MHYRYRLSKTPEGWKAFNIQLRTSTTHENKHKLIAQIRVDNDSKHLNVRKNKVIITINAVET